MKSCDALRRLVSPFLDGELVGEDRTAFEEHVASCDACRKVLDDEASVVAAVQGALPLSAVPPELRQKVEVLLARPARRRRVAGLLAAAAVLLLASVAGLLWRPWVSPPPDGRPISEFASLAADTHLRYASGQLPLEVTSDGPEELTRWFSGRVPFHLTLPDYPVGPGEMKFYRLEGGRLVSFRNDYAAYVAYRMEQHPISLLVTGATMAQPSGGETLASGSLLFHLESVAGLKVFTWTDNGLTYALVSDLSVSGSRSCLVCHGAPEQRRKIEGFDARPAI